jgi:hypothetical protein
MTTSSDDSRDTSAATTFLKTVERNPFIRPPVWPKQRRFLLHSDEVELFYGGAGGGGKSMALLFGALQYVHIPYYSAILFRRTLKDLVLPGALLDRARDYLAGTPARWHPAASQFKFPSGATINFAYLDNENDKLRYRSAEFQYCAFDELTTFTESQYAYLFTRLRRPNVGPLAEVPLRMRSASNPGGPGHHWVKRRFVNERTRKRDTMFIPATMADNGSLDIDAYRATLAHTDEMTRLQIELGLWDAIEGGRFRKEKFGRYRWEGEWIFCDRWRFLPRERPIFVVCDWNASSKTTSDFTVIGVFCLAPNNDLVWLACERFHAEIPDIIPAVQRIVRIWKPSVVGVESVAANNAVAKFLDRSIDPVMTVRHLSPMGRDKLVRAQAAIIRTDRGQLFLPEVESNTFPLDEVETELVTYTGDEKLDAHDDCVDVLAYACEMLPFLEQTGRPPGVEVPVGTRFGTGPGFTQNRPPTDPATRTVGLTKITSAPVFVPGQRYRN